MSGKIEFMDLTPFVARRCGWSERERGVPLEYIAAGVLALMALGMSQYIFWS